VIHKAASRISLVLRFSGACIEKLLLLGVRGEIVTSRKNDRLFLFEAESYREEKIERGDLKMNVDPKAQARVGPTDLGFSHESYANINWDVGAAERRRDRGLQTCFLTFRTLSLPSSHDPKYLINLFPGC
jgi:hypothetical protein